MCRIKNFLILIASLFFFACSSPETSNTYLEEGVAVSGFDVVSYFEESKAQSGNDNIFVIQDEAQYNFTNEEHKKLFLANPEKYLPAYGGWCGYAVANNSNRMAPNPEQWKIQNGRLILFFDNVFTKLQGGLLNKWNEDPEAFQKKADTNWLKMTQKKE